MEKETRPAFLFYAADFSAGVKGMDAGTIGMYVLLLCYQWENGGIPNDEKQLWRIASADSIDHFRDAWAMLKHKFSSAVASGKQGYLQNDKLEVIRITTKETNDAAKKKARDAALKRWEIQRAREAMLKECSSNAQAMPESMQESCSSNAIIGNGNGDIHTISNSEQSIISNRGLQGGIGRPTRPAPEWYEALYLRFVSAYGQTGRPIKRFSIESNLMTAVDCCTEKGMTANEAANFLCEQAKRCAELDAAAGNTKRLNPDTWLDQGCYQMPITPEVVPKKETPSQKLDRETREAFDRIQNDVKQ